MIGLLDDPDIGVRLYAIAALRRLTGSDYGYRYYAAHAERAAAVARWQAAARAGELTVGNAADPPRASPFPAPAKPRPAS